MCLLLFDADFTAKALSTSISISKPGLCAEHSGRSFKVTTRREKRAQKKGTRASAIYLIAAVSVYVDSWQVLMRVAPKVMEPLYCYYALWRHLCAFAGGRARSLARECMNYSLYAKAVKKSGVRRRAFYGFLGSKGDFSWIRKWVAVANGKKLATQTWKWSRYDVGAV